MHRRIIHATEDFAHHENQIECALIAHPVIDPIRVLAGGAESRSRATSRGAARRSTGWCRRLRQSPARTPRHRRARTGPSAATDATSLGSIWQPARSARSVRSVRRYRHPASSGDSGSKSAIHYRISGRIVRGGCAKHGGNPDVPPRKSLHNLEIGPDQCIKSSCSATARATWNQDNRFTGWTDVGLTDRGVGEARAAGRLLAQEGYRFDVAHTSVLSRAIKTLWLALEAMNQMWVPVHNAWRLNERHYGALQGLNKAETAAKFGDDQVLTGGAAMTRRPRRSRSTIRAIRHVIHVIRVSRRAISRPPNASRTRWRGYYRIGSRRSCRTSARASRW